MHLVIAPRAAPPAGSLDRSDNLVDRAEAELLELGSLRPAGEKMQLHIVSRSGRSVATIDADPDVRVHTCPPRDKMMMALWLKHGVYVYEVSSHQRTTVSLVRPCHPRLLRRSGA